MIRELKIKNFAIIDSLSLEFQPGLNILTGETGAGKSILVDALGLVLGERAQTEQIKTGSEEAEVQALFEAGKIPLLEELGIATDDGIIVRRIISRTGKTRAYINDTLMNVKTLEELGSALVDIHGQNEHQSLIFPDQQMDLVDSFGRHDDVLDRYRAVYGALRETEARLHDLKEKAKERAHRVDLLQFQIDEIRTAGVKPGEAAAIEEERTILLNATRLRELCEEAYHLIHGQEQSVSGNLKTAVEHLRTVQEFDQTAKEPFDLLNAAMPLLSDAIVSLRSLKERYSADPERLEEVQKRLDVLKNLRKKYGESEEEILAYLGTIVPELETLLSADEAVDELSRKQEALQAEIRAVAHQLTEKRRAASKRIERLVTEKLKDLAFRNAVFMVDLTQRRDAGGAEMFAPRGADAIEFLFSANPSEPPKPLKKVASGGELSRVMLAVKSVFADVDHVPVMVFDEIDAGIGGKAAQSVGRTLKDLSSRHQVFCVTHLAQIASRADAHFLIEKRSEAKRVRVQVHLLRRDERVHEIARMLSGEITPSSLKHSEELLRA